MPNAELSLRTQPIHPLFGVRVLDFDLSNPVSAPAKAELRQLFDRHSVLVFENQTLSPQQQVDFSASFGTLERAITHLSDQGAGAHIAHLTNVAADGSLISPQARQQQFHAANRFWHTDSSFKPQPALASMLYALEVPTGGGETQFVSTRVAFQELPEQRRNALNGLWAVHDFQRSRDLVAPDLVEPRVQKMLPPVSRPLVRTNPNTGEQALYIASHAIDIEGHSRDASRALLDELLDWCTRDDHVYTHRWRAGDLVMWDNRATMHRGRPWDATRERRVMARTTVIDEGYDHEPGIRAASTTV